MAFHFDALVFSSATLALNSTRSFKATRRNRALGTFAGTRSLATYWIAVWAMTVAPIALVAAVRETSVLFAVGIGAIWMRERAEIGKLVAATIILNGFVLVRI